MNQKNSYLEKLPEIEVHFIPKIGFDPCTVQPCEHIVMRDILNDAVK